MPLAEQCTARCIIRDEAQEDESCREKGYAADSEYKINKNPEPNDSGFFYYWMVGTPFIL